jgi:uncharacterized protein (DUF362 family)
MDEINRRAFLRILGALLGSTGTAYLLGCADPHKLSEKSVISSKAGTPTASPTTFQRAQNTPQFSNTPKLEPISSSTPVTEPDYPDLVVARNGEPEAMVRKAVRALGGMERFVSDGDLVVIKPNICVAYHTYEYAATTNPFVVGALVKMALESGARKVKVMDFPFGGTAEQAYQVSGITAQVKKAGGKMVVMSGLQFVTTSIPDGKDLKQCKIYQDVLDADVLINVPIAKHHELARLTLGMKNLMGVIYNRPLMHGNLGQRLADLNSLVRSDLVVVDAVRILMNHGPSGGNLNDVRKADTVIASADIVAADSYAAGLFGVKPEKISYIKAGAEMGLGRKELDRISIKEINLG